MMLGDEAANRERLAVRAAGRQRNHADPADLDAGVAQRGDGLDVVPVTVGGEHPPHPGGP